MVSGFPITVAWAVGVSHPIPYYPDYRAPELKAASIRENSTPRKTRAGTAMNTAESGYAGVPRTASTMESTWESLSCG
jgi:hypothetical protein